MTRTVNHSISQRIVSLLLKPLSPPYFEICKNRLSPVSVTLLVIQYQMCVTFREDNFKHIRCVECFHWMPSNMWLPALQRTEKNKEFLNFDRFSSISKEVTLHTVMPNMLRNKAFIMFILEYRCSICPLRYHGYET